MKYLFAAILTGAALLPSITHAQGIPGPAIGAPAPGFTVVGLNGKPISLASFRGRVVVLNFWATWCPPCRAETPDMINAYRTLRSPSVAFLGVDSTEAAPIVHAFVASKGLPYPVALDPKKDASSAYDVRGIPTTFVIDEKGIVRARFVDIITGPQLAAFVKAAKAQQNGSIVSDVQNKIDSALDLKQFAFTGDHDTVLKNVKAATDAIDASNKLLDNADPAKGEVTDYLKTRAAQAALLDAATTALAKVAVTPDDRKLLYRMQGDLATDREQWDAAVAAYLHVLQLDPKNTDALSGLGFAYYEKKDWGGEINAYQQYVALTPDADTYIEIGKGYLQLKDFRNAIDAHRKAVQLTEADLAKKKSSDNLVSVAHAWLYLGRAYVASNDKENAHLAFVKSMHYGSMLPPKSSEYERYTELPQEADVALNLTDNSRPGVSLAPWTGADLPGSLASTIKYRLVVSGKADSTVRLRATNIAKGWIASFCSDRLCSPMQLALRLPQSGVKIVEFQLIHNEKRAPKHTKFRVQANGVGGSAASAVMVASAS
ncbi:MAG: redoxin domain-containing protein [Candidatus Eremiobacteraeota bacterium]|nr:redoxin domain-containing protein [Candidatus Eremiobacteraeota bacterium]